MKILRILCNVLLFFVLMIGVSLVQVGVYDLSAAQSNEIQGIHILAPNDESVAYFDSYTFWADDISENFKQPAKYRIRNWVGANWWKKGMAWADKTIDIIAGAIKPIVVPIAQVNAIKNYYGYEINNFDEVLLLYTYDGSEEAYNNALYEVCVIFDKGYKKENVMTVGENPIPITEYQYTGSIIEGNEYEYGKWVSNNGQLYNHIWKLNKYNSTTYTKYFNKFINDNNGIRSIKTAIVVLYYQQIVSLVVVIFFLIKYPVSLFQGRYVGNDIKDKK